MSEAIASSRLHPGVGVARLLSDDRLARRAANGDERAFAAIFGRYHQDLYRYCLAIVGNPEDAQDVLQNTMVKALRALPGEKRQIQLKPWLYRVAHNESVDLLRRRRETRELDPTLAATGSGLAEEAAARERLRGLIADLDDLPEQQRGALIMRELAGLGLAEIGTALGTSTAVARQTLFEARRSLRQMAEGREMSCETVSLVLSDGDGRVTRRRDVRAHLRTCASCRRFGEEIAGRERDFAVLAGLPAVAAAGILQGLIGGGGGGAGGGGIVAALGGCTAPSVGAAVAFKGVALIGVAGVIGAGAAERGGLIDLGLPGEGDPQAIQVRHAWSVGQTQAPSHLARVEASAPAGVRGGAGVEGGGQTGAPKTDQAPVTGRPPAGETAGERATNPVLPPVDSGEGKATGEGADEADAGETADPVTQDPGSTPQDSSAGSEESTADQGQGHSQGKGQEKEKDQGKREEKEAKEKEPKQSPEPGSSESKGNGGKPSKPTHPEHPSTPSSEKGPPSSPPGQAVREEHSQAPAAPPGQRGGESPGQEGPPGQGKGQEKGKKSQALP